MGFEIIQSVAPVQERRNRLDSIHERLRGERERMRVRHRTGHDNRAQQMRDRRRRELEFVEAMEHEIRLEVEATESRSMNEFMQRERIREDSDLYTLNAAPRSPWRHLQQLAALSGETRSSADLNNQINNASLWTPDVNGPPSHRRIIPAYAQPTFPNNIISRTATTTRDVSDLSDTDSIVHDQSEQNLNNDIFTRTFALRGDDSAHSLERRPTQSSNYTNIPNNRRYRDQQSVESDTTIRLRRRETDFTTYVEEKFIFRMT